MSCLLQISDPHFGTEQPPVVDALERLAQALAPDAVLMSGDLTQRATREEFAAARRFADRLGARKLLAVPGNHDIPLFNVAARVFAPYAGFRRAFGPELEPSLDTARWLVLALNTTRPWRHKDGQVSAAQVDAVARRLETASPGQLRIVVVHQPVAVTDPDDAHDLLHGHAAAVRRWAEAGADLVLGGHIHLPYVLPLHDAAADGRVVGGAVGGDAGGDAGVGVGSAAGTAPLPRRLWAVQAGTAVSTRLRRQAGNSVNVVRRDSDAPAEGVVGCAVERWDYSAPEGDFVCVRRHRLALGPVGGGEPGR